MTIGSRLKSERKRLNLSQPAIAAFIGISKQSQINYEKGERSPDANYLQTAAQLGMDINFIITGEKVLSALTDKERLALAISAVEEGLQESESRLNATKKAELIIAAYDLITDHKMPQSKIIQFIKATA